MATYPYRPQRWLFLAMAAVTAAASAYLGWAAATGRTFAYRSLLFAPAAAVWVHGALAAICGLAAAVAILAVFAPARTLTLDGDGITVPTGFLGRRPRAVRWSEVRAVEETAMFGTAVVTLVLADGTVSITNRMLGKAAYEQVRAAVRAATRR
jgi:hypothetical protein